MADIKLALVADANNPVIGDLYLNPNGTVQLTASLSEDVAQELWIRLRLFRGEWFLDPDQGIPYFESILGQKTPLSVIGQIFRSAILSVPGIASLDSFELTRNPQRAIGLSFSVTLSDGSVLRSSDFAPFVIGEQGGQQ